MPSTSHYIRTVQTQFTGTLSTSSSTASSSSSSSSRENIHHHTADTQSGKYPPGLSLGSAPGPWRTSPTASGSGSKRPQRPPIRIPFSNRRTTLPPPPSTGTVHLGPQQQYSSWNHTLVYDTAHPPVSRTYRFATDMYAMDTSPSYAVEPVRKAMDRDERSKLVAGILLHRVHAVGKPLRRKPEDREKPYVRSGLSRVVPIEA